jgi:hypothetical protein
MVPMLDPSACHASSKTHLKWGFARLNLPPASEAYARDWSSRGAASMADRGARETPDTLAEHRDRARTTWEGPAIGRAEAKDP